MVIGGTESAKDSEILDFHVDASETACPDPADLPVGIRGAVGAYIRGRPMICGGYGGGDCYVYHFENNTWIQEVK